MKSYILQVAFGNKRVWASILGAVLVLAAFGARADTPTYYWDINGSDPGAADNGNPPTGDWYGPPNASTNWTLDSTGSSPTFWYSNRADIVFAATGDPTWSDTPDYTVTVHGNAQVSDIVFKDGNCTLTTVAPYYLDKDTPYIAVMNDVQGWPPQIATMNSILTSTAGTSNGLTLCGYGGVLVLGGANTYLGPTTVEGGTLQLGASQAIPPTSPLILAGGDDRSGDPYTSGYTGDYVLNPTFAAAGYSQTLGPLLLTGPDTNQEYTLDFGGSASALAFADSHLQDWGGIPLVIYDYLLGVSSLRFGTNSAGLTPTQLGLISFDFQPSFYNYLPAQIDANGFVSPCPTLSVAASGSNSVTLTWNAINGYSYNIQCKTNLNDLYWSTNFVKNVVATNTTASFTDKIGTNSHRYYRIQLMPGESL